MSEEKVLVGTEKREIELFTEWEHLVWELADIEETIRDCKMSPDISTVAGAIAQMIDAVDMVAPELMAEIRASKAVKKARREAEVAGRWL